MGFQLSPEEEKTEKKKEQDTRPRLINKAIKDYRKKKED